MTSDKNEDQENEGRRDRHDILSEHPGTETSEGTQTFHMIAEPPASTTGDNDNINHPSPTSASLGHSTSTVILSASLPSTSHHLLQPDPYDLPDNLWFTPSTSSASSSPGGNLPEVDDLHPDHLTGIQEPRRHLPLGWVVPVLASVCTSHPSWTATSRHSVATATTTAAATTIPTSTSRSSYPLSAAACAAATVPDARPHEKSLKTHEET